MSRIQTFYRELIDRNGNVVSLRIELDLGTKFEREIARLGNKATVLKLQRCASSAGGVIRVCKEPAR
jgi:hypothetical protein